jgi:serine/threonine-protein kinase
VSVAHAVPILQGMLAGLEAAHAQGVVHRDLKPGNVFLAREPQGLFAVKLLDFGIAKVMDVAGGMGNKTKTGMLLGTPAYMSPEQIKSAKDVDARADLWSAGVMFYEMLTGRTAFPAPTEYARLSAVLQYDPEPVETIDPELAILGPFLARALQKDPEARFQTAREMSLSLHAAASAAANERKSQPNEPASRVVVAPLSRLPDRAWVDGSAVASVVPSGAPSQPPAPSGTTPTPAPIDEQGVTHFESAVPKSSTLASAGLSSGTTPIPALQSRPFVRASAPPDAAVDLAALPQKINKGAPRVGVRVWVVLLLVLFALAAGIAIGFGLAQRYTLF